MEYINIITAKEKFANNEEAKLYKKGTCSSNSELINDTRVGERAEMIASQVPLDKLSTALSDFSVKMDKILTDIQLQSKEFDLEEIEVSLDVTASGGVRLIGSSLEAGASGGIKLIFKRK